MAPTNSDTDELDGGWYLDEKLEGLERSTDSKDLVKRAVAPGGLKAPLMPSVTLDGRPKRSAPTPPPARAPASPAAPSRPVAPATSPKPRPPPTSPARGKSAAKTTPPAGDIITIRPPVPAAEYVAQMMGQAPDSEADPRARAFPKPQEDYRGAMATLLEEEPLRFDIADPPPAPKLGLTPTPVSAARPAPSPARPAPSPAPRKAAHSPLPSIETIEVFSDDLDPDLLRDTPVPPRRPADELDDLAIDDLLNIEIPASSPATGELSMERSRGEPVVQSISDVPLSGASKRARAESVEVEITEDDAEQHARITVVGDAPNAHAAAEVKLHDRFALGDYSGALVLAEALLEEVPAHEVALRYAESCREMLRQMYISRLGDGDSVPRLAMAQDQLRWLTLDNRVGFLLSCIDGSSSVEELLDVCGMPALDALRAMYDLLQQGAIVVEPPSSKRR